MSVSVDRGGEVNLSCTYPLEQTSVNISWTGSTEDNPIVTPLSGNTKSTLSIMAVNDSHTGDYFCTAQFDDIMVYSAVATLTVNCKYKHVILNA